MKQDHTMRNRLRKPYSRPLVEPGPFDFLSFPADSA
jgi:hypothetical protein